MQNLRTLLFLVSLPLLCGCASHYSKIGADFAKAHAAAGDVVGGLVKESQRVARIEEFESTFLAGRAKAETDGFVALACAGSDALVSQRAAIRTLAGYSESLGDLSKAPEKNVAALWASIAAAREEREATTLKVPAEVHAKCAEDVRGLLAMSSPPRQEAVHLAVAKLSAIVGAMDKILVAGLGLIDEHARAEALAAYVNANKDTIRSALVVLGQKSQAMESLCEQADHRRTPYCRRFTTLEPGQKELPVPTRLDGALLRLKWASLRHPFHYYRATSAQLAAWAPSGKELPPLRAAAMMRRLERLNELFAGYDALRGMPYPGDVSADLAAAQEVLVDLANHRISAADAWTALAGIAGVLGEMAAATKEYREARSLETKPRPEAEAETEAGAE